MHAAVRGVHASACDEDPLEALDTGERERVRRGKVCVCGGRGLRFHTFI